MAQRARWLWLAVRGAVMVSLFSLLAGFSSTAVASTCAINWSFTNTGSSSYTYPFTTNDYNNCDPGGAGGVYGDPALPIFSVTTTAHGTLAIDTNAPAFVDRLIYTPPVSTYSGTDTATLYDAVGMPFLVTITVTAKPGAPTIGTATAGDTQATVSFTAPASNGGSAITGYTATANPGGATATGTASPLTVTGLTNGTAYTFTVTATNAIGTGPSSAASNSVTPKASQSITFANPGAQTFGSTPTLVATATSGLTPTFSSATTSVCTITSGGALTFVSTGTCTINADQAGNGSYLAAATVSRSFNVVPIVPGAPTIGTATAGDTQATVSFTAPSFTGGATITGYTVTASPGGATGTGVSSPIAVSGLTDGTAYTFTVTATNSAGTGAASAASNAVTPKASQSITFTNPGSQNFGTTPTLTATATSGLSVSFSSSTTAVCIITSGGALTFIGTGTCTINADQAGNGSYLAASTVSRSFTVNAVVSGAPVIGVATAGDTQATVSFTAPGFTGGATITNYTVTSSPGGLTGAGGSSPVVVTGLTNGTAYTFTVTATNSAGTGAASAASNAVTPKATQTITFTNPGTQSVGATPALTATASSGLPVTFSSASTSVCTVTSGGALTIIRAGTCAINADQAGNGTYLPAPTVAQSFTVNGPAITVSPGTLPSGTVGVSYNQTATASGGTAPYTYAISAGALPTGVSFSPSGALSAVPTASGTFGFTITATDANGATGSSAYTMTVAAPTMTMSPAAGALSATAGTAYSSTFSVNGGTSPYTYAMVVTSGTMPAGLSWNAATTTLSGTPAAAGTVTFSLTATDSSTGAGAPFATTRAYTLTVSAPAIALTPGTLSNPAIATAYSQSLSASGGTAPYTYAVTPGTLPTGLSLSSGGVLSGTPTSGGAFNFTITVTDANGFTANRAYSVVVSTPVIAVNPAVVPSPTVNTPYSQAFSGTGGTAPYTYAVASGTLPAGMTLSSAGVLSGTPTVPGSSTFTVRVTDSSTGTGAPYSGTRSYTLVVGQVIGTAPATTVTTLSNAPVTLHPTANASGGPFSAVTIVSAPASGTAVVNGLDIIYTPGQTTSGTVNFTYALINTAGTSAPIPVTVNVNAVPIAVAQKQAATSSGQAVSVDLTEGATGGPFMGASLVSVVPSNAGTATIVQKAVQTPAGLKPQAVSASTYVLNFTPSSTYSGQAVLTYTLSNAFATSLPATVQVSVTARRDPSADPDVAGLINAQIQAARRFATTQIDNYNRRLEALHGTGRAPSGNGLSIAMPGQRVDMQARCQDVVGISAHDACLRGDGQGVRPFARGKRPADGTNDKSNADAGPDLPGADAADTGANSTDPNLAFWSAGTLDFGFANTGAQRSGFRFTTGGVTAGADYRVSDQFSVGGGFGYGRDSTDIGNAGTKSTGDSYSLALYGSYRPLPSLFVDGVAGFGTLSFDSRRWVTDANDFATGKRNGKQMFASVSAGYEHRDRTWLVSPYGRLSVSQSTLDQFSESGTGINALTYFEQTVTTVSGTLGLRAEYTQKTKWGTLLPFVRVEYQHDFNGQSNAGLAYADLASVGPAYYVAGTPFGRDRMQIGLGSKFRTGPLTFGLDYTVMMGMGGLQQGVRLMFAAPF